LQACKQCRRAPTSRPPGEIEMSGLRFLCCMSAESEICEGPCGAYVLIPCRGVGHNAFCVLKHGLCDRCCLRSRNDDSFVVSVSRL
jgi:hypothetical protein